VQRSGGTYVGWRLVWLSSGLLLLCLALLTSPLYHDDFGEARRDPIWIAGPALVIVLAQLLWTGIVDIRRGVVERTSSPVGATRPWLLAYALVTVAAAVIYFAAFA
jgi:hypothetical protein